MGKKTITIYTHDKHNVEIDREVYIKFAKKALKNSNYSLHPKKDVVKFFSEIAIKIAFKEGKETEEVMNEAVRNFDIFTTKIPTETL